MKNVISKLIFTTMILITAISTTCAEEHGFKNPKWLYSSTDCITITHVQFTDSITVLDIHEKHIPTWWVRIDPNALLIDQDGKEYKLIRGEGVTPGELFITPECGYADFKLYFEAMPVNTQFFDYVEGHKTGDHRIYGVHNANNPIQVPEFLPKLNIEEFESKFYEEGTVILKGAFENYSDNSDMKSLLMTRANAITRKDSPITIDINPDGTFETSFKANHPKFEQILIRDKNKTHFYQVYTVPGCTTELYFDKELNMTMSSKDQKVWECQRMVNHNIFDICQPKPFMERYEMCKNMSFNQFGSALVSEKKLQLNLIDYIAWRDKYTLLERYYAKLITEINYSEAIFDYYYHIEMHLADSLLSKTEEDFLKNEYQKDPCIDEYEFIKQAPHSDIACLATPNFNIFVNRYEFSKILFPEIFKSRVIIHNSSRNLLKNIQQQDKKNFDTDMAITGEKEPSMWAILVALQNAEHYLKDVLVKKKSWQKMYYEYLKELTCNYPVISVEIDKLYNSCISDL